MSDTYHLICIETGEEIWIGQNFHQGKDGKELGLYTTDEHVERLRDFLHRNLWKPLVLWNEYSDYEGNRDDFVAHMRKAAEEYHSRGKEVIHP